MNAPPSLIDKQVTVIERVKGQQYSGKIRFDDLTFYWRFQGPSGFQGKIDDTQIVRKLFQSFTNDHEEVADQLSDEQFEFLAGLILHYILELVKSGKDFFELKDTFELEDPEKSEMIETLVQKFS